MWFSRKKQPPIRSLIGEGTVVHGEPIGESYELRHNDDLYLGGYLRVRVYVLS